MENLSSGICVCVLSVVSGIEIFNQWSKIQLPFKFGKFSVSTFKIYVYIFFHIKSILN